MIRLAVILIRGLIGISADKKETLSRLGLNKKFSCSVIPDSPSNRGMIDKVKDYITFGVIDEETEKELSTKRKDELPENKNKNVFRLNPPRGGFERKGTKNYFTRGGALGNRKDKITDLIKRML